MRRTNSWIRQAARWWYVLRYHRKSQLVMRLVGMARRRLLQLTGGRGYTRPLKVLPTLRKNLAWKPLLQLKLAECRGSGTASNAREIIDGRYTFLNQQRALPDPVDWRLESWPEVPHLWRFCLHYHEFLLDLAAEGLNSGEPRWFERSWQLIADWIENNRLADSRVLTDAWHPYCISRRLPVWILLWSASAPGEDIGRQVLGSMVCQARFLQRHLERDLGGNHLLENARALVLIGAFLEGPDAERWLRIGARILRKELDRQVLPHGEHFERSPMYHALMLEAVLDIRDAIRSIMPDLAAFCNETAEKMAAFLGKILHPDTQIPLLGDSYFGEAPPAGQLLARAADNSLSTIHYPLSTLHSPLSTDYWIYRHGGDFLFFDAGPVGPDHLPAHAHADLLGFEASVQGRRLFVDSGVFGYQDDEMRRYCRSSAAHNVLVVDDCDQCDMWSSFRMGYRGWPFGFASGETHGFHWARAHHNAYRRLGVPTVGRWIACRPGGPWFCVDWARGKGSHKLTSRLHLHPDVGVEQIDPDKLRIRCHDVVLYLQSLTPGTLTMTTGWYCPQFGYRLRCPVVQWTAATNLPTVCGWSLIRGNVEGEALLDFNDAEQPVLVWREGNNVLKLHPGASFAAD